jgi:hypothetical protein
MSISDVNVRHLGLTNYRRVLDQESRSRKQEDLQRDRMEQLERMVQYQTEKLERLESLVYTFIGTDSRPALKDLYSTNHITNQSSRNHTSYQSGDETQSSD